MKSLALFVIMVVGLASTVTASGPLAPVNDAISYDISLVSSAYNATENTTTFTYAVTSGTKPSISHWTLVFGEACFAKLTTVTSNDSAVSAGVDPTTGQLGIKFDTGYDDGETRTVTLTLGGYWGTGDVTIAVKSGNGYTLGTVQGPVCAEAPPQTFALCGEVFFDANYNGVCNPDEIGLGGVTVTLQQADGTVVATTTSDANGAYTFTDLPVGSYLVLVADVNGLMPTTLNEHAVELAADTCVDDTGYGLDFTAIGSMSANGFTIGYWKTNIDKALKGTTKGVQVSAATLASYTTTVGGLALEPFAGLTLNQATATLSATGSQPSVLLAKQLLGSEYNYANGAHLNGDASLTYLFVFFGEHVLKHAAEYPADYVLKVKDWFDAYNNTHGGAIVAPAW